jgi:hypothetical protein
MYHEEIDALKLGLLRAEVELGALTGRWPVVASHCVDPEQGYRSL